MPSHSLLPTASRIADGDLAFSDLALTHNVAPMDVSADGTDAFSKAIFIEQIEDIDAEDFANPQLVSIYVNPIYSYMRQLEVSIFHFM